MTDKAVAICSMAVPTILQARLRTLNSNSYWSSMRPSAVSELGTCNETSETRLPYQVGA